MTQRHAHQHAQKSYFDLRPAHRTTASPTASLAADLSQNFHLGASPAAPTPRRSLMAQFSFTADSMPDMGSPSSATTPFDMSSPGEMMETSPIPLPKRPGMAPARSASMFDTRQTLDPPAAFVQLPARKVGALTARPAMQRGKAMSAFAVPRVPEKKLSALEFLRHGGAGVGEQENTPPVHEEGEQRLDGFAFPVRRKPVPALDATSRAGRSADLTMRSPLTSMEHANGRALPRGMPAFRRTQSMIGSNEEFLAPELAQQQVQQQQLLQQTPRASVTTMLSPLSPELATSDCQILPSFQSKQDQLRRISGQTFADVLEGKYKGKYDRLVVIDCRFPHEYEGGHIPTAVNVSSLDVMDTHALLTQPEDTRSLLIFHCEYSAHRAPRVALHLRNRDRALNAHRYPKLFYPEVYILNGGYSAFFKDYRHLVGDSGYVAMNDPSHKPLASKQMHDFRKQRINRTQSYTFGQPPSAAAAAAAGEAQSAPLGGGERMERESNFRLQDRPRFAKTRQYSLQSVRLSPPKQWRPTGVPIPQKPHAANETVAAQGDERFGGCSDVLSGDETDEDTSMAMDDQPAPARAGASQIAVSARHQPQSVKESVVVFDDAEETDADYSMMDCDIDPASPPQQRAFGMLGSDVLSGSVFGEPVPVTAVEARRPSIAQQLSQAFASAGSHQSIAAAAAAAAAAATSTGQQQHSTPFYGHARTPSGRIDPRRLSSY